MAKKVGPDSTANENKDATVLPTPPTELTGDEQASAEEQSVVKLKGVSGKTITGVVRVVKAKRKAKPESDAPSESEKAVEEAAPEVIVEEPVETSAKTDDVSPVDAAEESTKPLPKVPRKIASGKPKVAEPEKETAEVGEPIADAPHSKDSAKAALESATTQPEQPVDDLPKQAEPVSEPRDIQVEKPKAAETTEGATSAKKPLQSNPPIVEKKPSGKPLGKVGNIFAGNAKNSALAETAKRHAQMMSDKQKRQTEHKDQSGNRQVSTNQRYQSRPSGQSVVGGFAKDKDAQGAPNRMKKPARKPAPSSVAPPMDLFSSGKQNSGSHRGKNQHDRNRRDFERDGQERKKGLKDRIANQDDYFGNRQRRGPKKEHKPQKVQTTVLTHVSLPDQITVKEFAEAIKKTSSDVIKALMGMGMMATINQVIDYDTAAIIAGEFNITTDQLVEVTEEDILFDESDDAVEDLRDRPPIVVVMGHVDHGKTSLLDFYRNSSVVSGEAGGITQHIGAYMVHLNDRQITFLDTPGHEAFTTMRARGAMVTDIAILVVAADDGVMPQTIEAINHAKLAGTQIIVAINKIDKEGANIDRVKQELAKYELIPEEWGGTTIMVPVSAKTGEGMPELLEMVLLTADVLELKANPDRQAKGTVIEAKLDKNRGPVATLLVQRGTLHVGETVVTGAIVGNVRAMTDATGKRIQAAGPSVPVEIIGLPEVPEAGEVFYGVEDDRMAKQLAEKRRIRQREDDMKKSSRMSLDNLYKKMAEGEVKDLNVIVKADVQGSVEAVKQSLERLSNDEVKVHVIHGAVGAITETDLRLAEVSNAIVIGFNVRPAVNVEEMAKESGIDLRLYRVIYNAIEDIEAAMKGMLDPEFEEVSLGLIELREVFKISSVGTVGGGYVLNGKITRSAQVRVIRDGIVIQEDEVASLRRFKDDVREVAQGYECGITLTRFHDLKEGDQIEAFEMREIERQ